MGGGGDRRKCFPPKTPKNRKNKPTDGEQVSAAGIFLSDTATVAVLPRSAPAWVMEGRRAEFISLICNKKLG